MNTNIIAEFSSSLNNNGSFKQYQVVVGSSFTDAYNEELDSASIILSQVKAEDRLINIKPYDFVRVFDASSWNETTQKYDFDHVYLVDNYFEKEDNITERLFSYTINLMSETKLLEKIQCPSLTITHEVKDGEIIKKTIFEKICEYMELYVPKVKKEYLDGQTLKWRYEPLIEIPGTLVAETPKYKSAEATEDKNIVDAIIGSTYELDIIVPELIGNSINWNNIVITTTNQYLVDDTEYAKSFFPNTGTVHFRIKSLNNMRGLINFQVTINCQYNDGEYTPAYYTPKQYYINNGFYDKFNVDTADLGSSYFTLRQLLTMLMQQVGCIPTVNDLKLSFLDFNYTAEAFNTDDTINYVQKSLSSDSFANTLVNTSSNVLDSENEVISETIGFRDRNNVLLKQQENLVLETKFPIYKVNEFKLNCILNSGTKEYVNETVYTTGGSQSVIFRLQGERNGNVITIKTLFASYESGWNVTGNLKYFITTFNKNGNVISRVQHREVTKEFTGTTRAGVDWRIANHYDFNETFLNNFSYYIIEAEGVLSFTSAGISGSKSNSKLAFSEANNPLNAPMMVGVDITPLIKESQERALLKTNYTDIHSTTTIQELATFLYGTVGYTIGSNQISGFSTFYNELNTNHLFAYQYGQTYIEGIYEWLKDNYLAKEIRKILREGTQIDIRNDNFINVSLYSPNSPSASGGLIKFTQFTFDIKYQPLNSFNLLYIKSEDNIDFNIEQFNGSDSGMVDFDRLSVNQQETVDRIGNTTLSISQRIKFGELSSKLHNIPAVYTRDGESHVIFKRTYTIGNYKYDVNYIGSKNAILKNYFTSIRTKYRAYQYVDVNQSTLRKENDSFYVRIGENYYNGDDHIYFEKGNGIENFAHGINNDDSNNSLKYMCERSYNKANSSETIKNDISLITNDNSMAIIYEQFDNVSAGPYIENVDYSTYYSGTITEERVKVGGVPQKWQEWNVSRYNPKHIVFYTSNLNYYDKNNGIIFYESENEKQQIAITAKAPILPSEAQQIKQDANVFWIVDDKTTHDGKTFFKDLSERLNHTVQFIYYSETSNVAWTENFIAANGFIEKSKIRPNAVYISNNMNINKDAHTTTDTLQFYTTGIQDAIVVVPEESGVPPYIKVNWQYMGTSLICKLCYEDDDGKVSDFIAFKRPDTETQISRFYITLNDTKTDYVMAVRDGVLYRKSKVKTNNLNREVQ